jgi:hypothetical protein
MAWIIGNSDDKEIQMLINAGHEIHGTIKAIEFDEMIEKGSSKYTEPDAEDMICVFVDCNISDLLLPLDNFQGNED